MKEKRKYFKGAKMKPKNRMLISEKEYERIVKANEPYHNPMVLKHGRGPDNKTCYNCTSFRENMTGGKCSERHAFDEHRSDYYSCSKFDLNPEEDHETISD